MTNTKDIWIETGYELFAKYGADGIKVESLSKKVGVSKSSFYYHFIDKELFVENLLEYHIFKSHVISKKERNIKSINPELINILIEHKIDLLFNRQLRINRVNKLYADTLIRSNKIIGNVFTMIWVKDLSLHLNQKQLEAIFDLLLENFYLQISIQNINKEWLSDYFENLKRILEKFI